MKLRWYQAAAVDAAWQWLRDNPGKNPVVVLPTGSGKSLVIAEMVRQALAWDGRVLVLQHRKELIRQNAEKIRALCPEVEIGIWSAGLKEKNGQPPVVVAGIQSAAKSAEAFGPRQLVIIDESHLVSEKDQTQYQTLIEGLRLQVPTMRVLGLTATPYRTGDGPLCQPGKLFQRVCFEASISQLIAEGWLCRLTSQAPGCHVATDKIGVRGGEFLPVAMATAFDDAAKRQAIAEEIALQARDRKSVLVFAAGVENAEHLAEALRTVTGERVGCVTGETLSIERQAILSQFRNGELRFCCNCDVLTTGFDAPGIDCVAIARATMSPGLFAQMVGRGLRTSPGKADCLVLDFGENIKRHGSLDDPQFGRSSGATGRRAATVEKNGRGRECPGCRADVPAGLGECLECGLPMVDSRMKKVNTTPDNGEILGPQTRQVEVLQVKWAKHFKRGATEDNPSPPTLRIEYQIRDQGEVGNLAVSTVLEFVCLQHSGFARNKACAWWAVRSHTLPPDTIDAAIDLLNRGACRMPVALTLERDGKFWRCLNPVFVDDLPGNWDLLPEKHDHLPTKHDEVDGDPFGTFSPIAFDLDDVPF